MLDQKISIIIPIYNAEKYLKKCLDSIINQTKKELEFILINDGSTDSTEEIIKSYKDERIKYFKNKNQGIGKTRNFGIDKATGDYIMFIDSDDWISKNTCEVLLEKALANNCDLVVCDFYREFDTGKLIEDKLGSFKDTTLKNNPKLLNMINLSPWNKLYKSSLIKDNKLRFIENLKYEDAPFVVNALLNAERIGKVDECLNYYCIHGNSETTVRDSKCFDILEIIKIIRDSLKEDIYLDEVNKLTLRMITNYTIQQRNQKDIEVGMKFIDQSFEFLEKNIPDYKNNRYYENRSILQRTIEKNKSLTKLYCKLTNKKYRSK